MSTAAKTPCTVSRPYFAAEAKPLTLTITDHDGKVVFVQTMLPREFTTGSLGWNANGQGSVGVGPIDKCKVQVGLNVTIANSKELPKV